MCKNAKLYHLGSEFIKKKIKKKIVGSFRFKVINYHIYSIETEVIQEFESLKSKIELLFRVFIKHC